MTEQLYTLAEQVLTLATQQGATAAEVSLTQGQGLSATARMGAVETLEYHRDQSISLTVYHGQAKGSVSGSDWRDITLPDLVKAACSIAELTAKDDCAGLADPERMPSKIPDLELSHPWELTPEMAIELALNCEQAALDQDPAIQNSEGADVSTYQGVYLYGNSHGFIGHYPATQHNISCSVIAQNAQGMQRDYWYDCQRRADKLAAPEQIGRQAAERACMRLGARQLRTQTTPILFAPEMTRSLLRHFIEAISGKVLYRQASFLLDSKGKAVFAPNIQLTEYPHLISGLGSAAFDQEGVATPGSRDIVIDGILQDYVLSSYSARKLGLESTANAGGVRNLSLQPGTQDFSDLLHTLHTGLLVTEMMGQGVSILTGDYSRGASGFWVEQGQIQYPVEEITIAGNLADMFKRIVAVGNDVDTRSNIRCGSMLIENMTVAGR